MFNQQVEQTWPSTLTACTVSLPKRAFVMASKDINILYVGGGAVGSFYASRSIQARTFFGVIHGII